MKIESLDVRWIKTPRYIWDIVTMDRDQVFHASSARAGRSRQRQSKWAGPRVGAPRTALATAPFLYLDSAAGLCSWPWRLPKVPGSRSRKAPTEMPSCAAVAPHEPRQLQVLFGELAKIVGHGTRHARGRRAVSDRIPSEAIAYLVDGAICLRACQADPAAGAARFVFEAER